MIYLDNHSTTRCDPRVVQAMLPWLDQQFGNPHSGHAAGIRAAESVDSATADVATMLGTTSENIVFTSGATESNNLAIRGVCLHPRQKRRRLVTVATEHPAVLDVMSDLERDGFESTIVPVIPSGDSRAGIIDLEHLADAVDAQTALVSVMWANNEIGAIAPMAEIADIAHRAGALLHSDATQAVGRIPIDIAGTDVDLLSASAHKFYGPKGVGVLVVGNGNRRVRLRPQIVGGGQQRGLRSGTMAPAMVVALATALRLCLDSLDTERTEIRGMRDQLWSRLSTAIEGMVVNGPELNGQNRLAGNLNVQLPLVEGQAWMAAASEVAMSTGSACSNVDPTPSSVLLSLGLSESEARRSVRMGVGRFNTPEEIDWATDILIAAWRRLRKMG